MDVQSLISTLSQSVAILGGAGYAGRKIFRAAKTVADNTEATKALSERLDNFSTETHATLADHAARLTLLESRPSTRRTS